MTNGHRPTCETCAFSHDLKRAGVTDLQCRRHPPVPLVTGMKINGLTGEQTATINHVAPMMARDFWCGEHRPQFSEIVSLVPDIISHKEEDHG